MPAVLVPPSEQYQCSVAKDFQMDLGPFSLIWPSVLNQPWECGKGRPCEVDNVDRVYLRSGDRLTVLDICYHEGPEVTTVPSFAFSDGVYPEGVSNGSKGTSYCMGATYGLAP